MELGCEDCPLKTGKVGTRGDTNSPIAIVGEGPGKKELYSGIPFHGKSGDILWDALPEEYHDQVFVTNAAQCWPGPKKDASIVDACTAACHDRLITEIEASPRKLIIALGNAALRSLTGNYSLKITQERGRLIPSELAELGILPIIHPAALLHGTGTLKQFQEDINYAVQLLKTGKVKKPIEPTYVVCNTDRKVKRALKLFNRHPGYIAGDVETSGLKPSSDYILDIGLCYKPEKVFIFPGNRVRSLKNLFKSRKHKFIWHNGKFDVRFLRNSGLKGARVDEDTMLLSYALNERPGYHSLEDLSGSLMGAEDYKHYVKPYLPNKDSSYALIPKPILYKYRLAPDVSYTLQLFSKLRPKVAEENPLEKLYTKILIPASEMLSYVEETGFPVDMEWAHRLHDKLKKETDELEAQFQEIAGHPINPRSPQQVAILFYDELGLKPLKKYGRSTAAKILEKLPPIEAVKALQAYRVKFKELSTYITGKKQGIYHCTYSDGRVHTTFLIHGSKTGRLASQGPNMQNPPRIKFDKQGNPTSEIRGMFVALEDYKLIEVDLNQAELRSLACLSGDEFLCGIYNSSDRSLHNEVAIEFFGVDYNAEQKMRAKAVNFGIIYGREAPSLAEEFDIPIFEAQGYIDKWFAKMPKAEKFINKCRRAPIKHNDITTCFGRKKRHDILPEEPGLIKAIQNEAANFPHQSIASDITLLSAIMVQRALFKLGAYIINLVHDSIIIMCLDNPETIRKVKAIVEFTMEEVPKVWGLTKIPFKAESKEGYRWGYLEGTEDAIPREQYSEVLEAKQTLWASI